MIALITRDLRIAFRAGGGFGLSLAFFFYTSCFFPVCDWSQSRSVVKSSSWDTLVRSSFGLSFVS